MEDEENNIKGVVSKSASVESQAITDSELAKINKNTLSPLKKEDIFTFKIIMGDNELDDRNYEPFNLNALKDLQHLYIGKTMIKDHNRMADNQIARVYDTELVQDTSKMTGAGEPYTQLIAKCYMLNNDKNKDLIQDIKAGIKKEVSTGIRPKHAWCSICGIDNTKHYCEHWWGREYDTQDGKKVCYFTLDGAKEAYEVSFVAVPAQPRAGTTKNYSISEEVQEKKQQIISNSETEKVSNNDNDKLELELRAKMLDSFLFIENLKEKEGK